MGNACYVVYYVFGTLYTLDFILAAKKLYQGLRSNNDRHLVIQPMIPNSSILINLVGERGTTLNPE
jgi:hypothetical protein